VEPVPEQEIHDGEIIAARLGGEGTVKRYFRRDDQVVLEPANSDYPPILVREFDDFAVLGRVGGLFRRFPARQPQAIAG
jgi:repressor LexA